MAIKIVLRFLVGFSASLVPLFCGAYELTTHAGMSYAAFQKSVLATDTIFDRLGLLSQKDNLGRTYIDVSDTSPPVKRFLKGFETDRFPLGLTNENNQSSAFAWVMSGAIREDDGSDWVGSRLQEPRDDPLGNINRFCNHFFDPYRVRQQTGFCLYSTLDHSPNWAIGTNDAFAIPVERATGYRNHFTVFGAREAMWRALTLQDKTGAFNIAIGNTTAEREQERRAYWATVFRSLGDVAHLIQDIAQPQHTRDEGHASDGVAVIEKYADARAGRRDGGEPAQSFDIDGLTLTKAAKTLRPLDYELRDQSGNLVGYPIPRFNSYTDYWTTSRGAPNREDSLTVGKGLADYSSRGFLTVGSSLTATTFSEFPMPPRASSDSSYSLSVPVSLCDAPPQSNLKMRYLSRNVVDSAAPSASEQIKLQARSVWTDPANSLPPQFTMNHCVLDDNLRVLIPRAVAYTTGLIDYFFRGRLDFTLPDENVYAIADHSSFFVNTAFAGGFPKLKVKIKNITSPVTPPGGSAIDQKMTSGSLVAIVKFKRNNCYVPDSMQGQPGGPLYTSACRFPNEEIVVSAHVPVPTAINDGYQPVTFDFTANRIPINAVDVSLQIAFRGTLGSEPDAVVVETKNISEPSFFSMENFTDCHINTDGSASKVAGRNTSVNFRFHDPVTDAVPATDIGSVIDLLPGTFARVALLTDNFSYKKYMRPDYSYSIAIALNDSTITSAPIANPVQWDKGRPLASGGNLYEHDGFGSYPGLATDTGLTGSQRCTASLFPNFTANPVPLTTLAF